MLPSTVFSTYFSFYYVDGLGLSIGLYALARTIYVFWDALAQPMAGFLSDRTRTRLGRRLPWLISTLPVYIVVFIMVFNAPAHLTSGGLFVWFMVFMLLFEATLAVVTVNYGALFPELYRGVKTRARASVVQQIFYIVALLIGTAITPIVYTALGFTNMAVLFAITFGVFMVLFLLFTREDPVASIEKPLAFAESFRLTLKNKPFWIFNIANIFTAAIVGLISASIAFYAKYVLNIQGAELSILMAATFVGVIPMSFVWYAVIRRMGSLLSWKVSIAVMGFTSIPLLFANNLTSGLIAGIVLSFGLAGSFIIPQLVLSELIDVDAFHTGKRREGIYMAVSNFLVRTSALLTSLAFLSVGIAFGYQDGDHPGSSPALTFRLLTGAVPIIFAILAFLFALALHAKDVEIPPDSRSVANPETELATPMSAQADDNS